MTYLLGRLPLAQFAQVDRLSRGARGGKQGQHVNSVPDLSASPRWAQILPRFRAIEWNKLWYSEVQEE